MYRGSSISIENFSSVQPRPKSNGSLWTFDRPHCRRRSLVHCTARLWAGELVSRGLGKEALGFGDVKMTAMMGAFLGWQLTLVALFLASFLGSVIGIGLVAVTRDRDYQIPLGSFLAIGAVAAAVAGEPLLNWYVGRMFPQ